jgi:hypothetical protein
MEEMVCPTFDIYVEQAIGYGSNPERMAAARRKLTAGRDTCLLFDTPTLTRHLEGLFRQMWAEYEAGALPVPDLTNLDVYFDLGSDLNLNAPETLSDEVYSRRYQEKLNGWHQTYPLRPDQRLWKKAG